MAWRGMGAIALMLATAAPLAAGGVLCPSCRFERVARCGAFLEGPSVDRSGRLRVVDYASGDILEVEGGACIRVANSGGHANGARLDPAGRLFISDARRGVLRLEADGRFVTSYAAPQGPVQLGANDLAFDADGGLYFTVPGSSSYSERSGQVYYQPPGGPARLFRSGLAFPNGIVVTPDGKFVLVGQFSDKTILSLPSVKNRDVLKGDYVLVHTEGGIGPDGMIIDTAGRLVWANFNGRSIGVATLDGTMLGNVPLPPEAGPYVTNIVQSGDAYFITEASKGEVWKLTGLSLR